MRYIAEHVNNKMFNNSTVMVAGATSTIGRYIIYVLMYLNDQYSNYNCKVVAMCRNEEKAKEIFAEYLTKESFEMLIHDVSEPMRYEKNVDYIFYAAGSGATKIHRANPVETMIPNSIGLKNTLDYAKKCSDFRGLLFFSSGAINGDTSAIDHDITETDYYPIDPLDYKNIYAVAKCAGEAICAAYYEEYGVISKIIRISHTYGPNIDLTSGSIYSDFISNILHNKNLVITGDGMQYRPFTYIADCIVAMFLILEKGEPITAYNMANSQEFVSMKELAELLVKDVFPEKGLSVEIKKPRLSDGPESKPYAVCSERLRKLGWNPQITIKEGFIRAVESFQLERM